MIAAAPPLSATGPALVSVFAPSSGHTRIDPIERRVQKRTTALPPPAPKLWIAMLLLAAPRLVLAAIIGTKPLRARADPPAATAVAVPSIEPTPVVAPPPAPVLPPRPMVRGRRRQRGRCGGPPRRQREGARARREIAEAASAAAAGRGESLIRKTSTAVASIWSGRPHHV